jgi:hypothetical protein
MGNIIKLTEKDLQRLVNKIIKESYDDFDIEIAPEEIDIDTKPTIRPDRETERRRNPFIVPKRERDEDPLPDLEPQGRRKMRGESKDFESMVSKFIKSKKK